MDTITDATNPSATPVEEPSLRTITMGVPDHAAIDASVPEVRATTEERFGDFDKDSVSHVVIQVSLSRQKDIFRYVGYHYDWNFPGPYWHFLGKMAAKALYDDRAELRELNYVPVGRREFIAYTTSMWTAAVKAGKAAGVTELPPLNVIEVNFKKPLPGQPLEMFWGPARGLITAKIRQCELKISDVLSTILTQRRDRE
ncbi:hypothetical protein QBC46DRAFT_251883 [Diplogelasinospora grovesii]|uniref:Uncharacterized protein n=1 Tax=Diplogelasinospora grovesii TaxID=303347 RepID=A0AAN6NGL1_9PEZI|nr:hypothetical protein QBC46DRAFT_251883 [Diplogelasinospora grovesii]